MLKILYPLHIKTAAMVISILIIGFIHEQRAFANCNKVTLNEAIYASQRLDAKAEPLIMQLAQCENVAIKQQTVFWGAFYFAMQKDENKIVSLIDKTFVEAASDAERDQIYFEARRGRWLRLREKIETGEPDYLSNLNARIILAHSFYLTRRYREGLRRRPGGLCR